MSVLNKYKKWKSILLINESKIFDLCLSLDTTPSIQQNNEMVKNDLMVYINANDVDCYIESGGLMSYNEYYYNNAINNGYDLHDIGLTGTDNGLITFNKNTITQNEYIEILKKTGVKLSKNNFKLHLLPITGNTNNFIYPCELNSSGGTNYYSFDGGFLQGFYKGFGYDYQILPQYINDGLTMEFVLRPKSNSTVLDKTLNNVYNENKGIFFYIGTRAENKFIEFYNYDLSKFKKRNNINQTAYTKTNLLTSEGHKVESESNPDIITDNGFLIYNQGYDCTTTKNWKQGDKLTIINNTTEIKENLYLILNRGENCYTTQNLSGYTGTTLNDPNTFIKSDIINNAFGLRITDDGRIGYRYIVDNCDNVLHYKIEEEYSFPNIISNDEWNVINVVFKIVNGELNECETPIGNRKMVIYIYVNGYLKFVSKHLPELQIRELNEGFDKQELVPFNISLGGGTQGLIESTWIDSYNGFPYILPIEENFAGTFIGDIKSFKIYDRMLQYQEIKNNYLFEKQNL